MSFSERDQGAESIRSNSASQHSLPNNPGKAFAEKRGLLESLPWLADPRSIFLVLLALGYLVYVVCGVIEFARSNTHTMLDHALLMLGGAASGTALTASRSRGRKGGAS